MRVLLLFACVASALLRRAPVAKSPITSSEKAAVGAALSSALGAISNHQSDDLSLTCLKMFPKAPEVTPEERKSPMWVSCARALGYHA